MIRNFILPVLLLFTAFSVKAQVFQTDTITGGPSTNRINLVYLGDGYTSSQLGNYINDVNSVNTKLFLASPFKEYRSYFRVFAIKVPSAESGAKHTNTASDCPVPAQPVTTPLNYFGSRFDYGNIHRLVVPDSFAKVQAVLANNLPAYHQAMMIVNSAYYGGSGGWLATSTVHASAAEIAIHELGHSFAGLADEYWAGPQFAAEKPNMTQESNPSLVKWKNWVGTNDVGVFPYSGGSGWFRPVTGGKCKMEVLGPSFCSVCTEAITERIHHLVKPIDAFTPTATTITNNNNDIGFSLDLIQPDPNTVRVTWKLDGNTIATNTDTITITPPELSGGNHIVTATVIDTTLLTRSDAHLSAHAYVVQWNINTATGVIDPDLLAARLKIYPNPFSEVLYITYDLSKRSDVVIELLTVDGRLVHKIQKPKQDAGRYQFPLSVSGVSLADGIYFVRFTLNGNTITEEKLRIRR